MSRKLKKYRKRHLARTPSFHAKKQAQLIATFDELLRHYAKSEDGKVMFCKSHADAPQVLSPVTERHAPGVYLREIVMPEGAVICGKRHATEHFNIILEGAVRCIDEEGNLFTLEAPFTFVSNAGMRKMFGVIRTCRWQTIHPNPDNLRETTELEKLLIIPEAHPALNQPKPALAGAAS